MRQCPPPTPPPTPGSTLSNSRPARDTFHARARERSHALAREVLHELFTQPAPERGWTESLSHSVFSGPKFFWAKIFFGPKNFFGPKHILGPQKILGPKNIFWAQKYFPAKTFFGAKKNFRPQKNFRVDYTRARGPSVGPFTALSTLRILKRGVRPTDRGTDNASYREGPATVNCK